MMRCGKTIFASFLTTANGYAISPDRVSTRSAALAVQARRAANRVSFLVLIDGIHDRAPRRPDEQFTEGVRGGAGVRFDGLVECDAVNR